MTASTGTYTATTTPNTSMTNNCPPQQLLHELGRTWMLALLDTLIRGANNFNEIKHELAITSKVLSERLQLLEEEGLVKKELLQEGVIEKTSYTLTKKAHDLYGVLNAYKNFVKKYSDEKLLCGEIACAQCPHHTK